MNRAPFPRRALPGALVRPLMPPDEMTADDPAALTIRPRADWARGLAPTGKLEQERAGDVKFLMVHHSVSSNTYAEREVPGLLRGIYQAHTGPKRWPDIAYNFFVDRFGGVWEGRSGSLAGPVKPDATGGSQGYAQLCCLLGDHRVEAPTASARRSMTALLAMLADRYNIDTTPGARAAFVSRGSNRWPSGTKVVAATIAGHRDMSQTECPGDAAYALIKGPLPRDVTAARSATTTPKQDPPALGTAAPAPATAAPLDPIPVLSSPVDQVPSQGPPWPALPLVSGTSASIAAIVGGLLWVRRRRRSGPEAAEELGRRHWTVLSSDQDKGAREAPLRAAHGQGWNERVLYGCVVQAAHPTDGVTAALRECHRVGDEMARSPQPADPVQAAVSWAGQVWRAGLAAKETDASNIDVALLLTIGYESVLVATSDSMGAILTTSGVTLWPRPSRRQGPQNGPPLVQIHQPQEVVATAALTSTIPGGPDRREHLAGLCRELRSTKDRRRRLRAYEHEFFGDAGFDVALLAFVPSSRTADPSHSRTIRSVHTVNEHPDNEARGQPWRVSKPPEGAS